MAKPTEANAKTQAAAIATAINAALHDTVLTGIFPEWNDPRHPMRQWQRFVKMDDQGTFTADDDYITRAYANGHYTKPITSKDDRVTNDPSQMKLSVNVRLRGKDYRAGDEIPDNLLPNYPGLKKYIVNGKSKSKSKPKKGSSETGTQ